MGDGDKTPLRLQFNPKGHAGVSRCHLTSEPDSCPFESWMMPWGLTPMPPTISRKAVPAADIRTT